jgi:tetratricopeptide (TPR) repeat protein
MAEKTVVMISSTARDLPEHRKQVLEACARQDMFPKMMEHLPAVDADAIQTSLGMVDEAEIYLGIFAHRYGYVPEGRDISITEMEYNRAVERGIPRLIFIMRDDYPVLPKEVDKGEAATRLESLKERLKKERVVSFFGSPEDLRGHVIDSLSQLRKRDRPAFHYVSDIPEPPEVYVAHPYTLSQAHNLIGRHQELNLITDWVARPGSDVYGARVLNVVAIGGMGKSALTWKWFNDIAPQEMKPLAGRMWWSFYESDATFENFVIRALSYATGRAREEIVKRMKPAEREEHLLAVFDRAPFLVALDGLERILVAYARMDASHLSDSDVGDHYHLRQAAAPRAGAFLRKLARVRQSRILISTRLYPADLQDRELGGSVPGSYELKLQGLSYEDALELWRYFGVSGSRDMLQRLFNTFKNHPLMIKLLAGEVRRFRPAPGDFDEWQKHHKDFNPYGLPHVKEVMAHILPFALLELDEPKRKTMHTISGLRMPTPYDTLASVLVGAGKAFADEAQLDEALTDLEDRELLNWDRRANRYDLHPIVRGVVWNWLDDATKTDVYNRLQPYFESLPQADEEKVESLEDLTPAIELFNAFIGRRLYDEAYTVFHDRLSTPMLYRLSANSERASLLEMFFPDSVEQPPHIGNNLKKAYLLNMLAQSYHMGGRPAAALPLYERSALMCKRESDAQNLGRNLCDLSGVRRVLGIIYESEAAARRAFSLADATLDTYRVMISLGYLGLTQAARGLVAPSRSALESALRLAGSLRYVRVEGAANTDLAQWAIWAGEYSLARRHALAARGLASARKYRRDFIRAARLQGAAALGLGDLDVARERLDWARSAANEVEFVEGELSALITLAELERQQDRLQTARSVIEYALRLSRNGHYLLLEADAYNVLAQIERDEGNREAAVDAAMSAYRKAWCDGPPFAYHWGLEAAKKHLRELAAPEPDDLPPFDQSRYEPMPEITVYPLDSSTDSDESEE